MSWELPALTTLTLSVVSFWWIGSPQSRYQRVIYALVYSFVCGVTLFAHFDGLRHLQRMYTTFRDAAQDFRLDVFLTQHFTMVLALGAVFWLLHRSLQTLLKPVPDLINILGVDIPESPDVSLAGIRADAATLSWTRPSNNRPVQRYSIQVNGVHVGESPGNEVAITVTGLKPNHFYNIRVVAVGPNNFQAGSAVVRLRTFDKNGRPQLGNSRLPTSFTDHEPSRSDISGEGDDSDTHVSALPSVEAAPVLDGSSTVAHNHSSATPTQRRNTINRRNSPSVTSADQPQFKSSTTDGPELSLTELNEKFESIRKETEDTQLLYAKDEAEYQQQEAELKKERDLKRQALKEKEEQTTQLKATIRTTMEQMRAAEKERAKKEHQLKEKESKKTKIQDSITRLETDIERMRTEREGFATQKKELEEKRNSDVKKLDKANAELQDKCAALEAELKDKGKQLQDSKAAREHLTGAGDNLFKEEDMRVRRDWDNRRKDLHEQLVGETKQGHYLDQQLRILDEQIHLHQTAFASFNHPGSSATDFDSPPVFQPKRPSINSGSFSNPNMSSPGQLAPVEPNYQPPSGFNHGFAPALFMDLTADESHEPQTEAELRAAGGPLSPSAQTLLPSNIFDEIEESDMRIRHSPVLREPMAMEEDPQSPASSSRSMNGFSSPHGSSHHLPFPQYTNEGGDGPSHSLNASPTAPPATTHRLTSLLSTFQRSRAPKTVDDGGFGPPIGSLKSGQSQSFPRGTDEAEILENRRRINFSFMSRNSTGPDGTAGNFMFPGRSSLSTRRLNPLKASTGNMFPSDRDGEGSRPASIASADMPRPSTDSGSIWNVPGDIAGLGKSRLWPNSDGRWPSRSGSRRPSLHGSTTALTTTLASADDEILDEHELLNPQTSPSQVGVIGSRPPGRISKSINQRLNPAAPTFMGNIFRKDRDKDKEPGSDKDKTKGKDKDRGRDRATKEDKIKGKDFATPSIEFTPSFNDSPSDSRMSRDTYSVHTQTSVSESHESLQLDSTVSNTPSDINSTSASNPKDAENVVRKLFRKGSSSKFSLSSRLGKESALFKKGPGSATYSDKNMSSEQRSSIGDLDDLGEDASQLGRSYDSMTSSPALGPSKSKDSKESRISSWRFSMKKKGKEAFSKEKESLDIDRATDEE